jgi:predicted aspartyl protease
MPKAACGFFDTPGGAPAPDLLSYYGPTIMVDIGFDPNYNETVPKPVPGITGIRALVDTGASESCIDSVLAQQLGLPIINRTEIAGAGGKHEINVHLAQIYLPALNLTILGAFAGVHLSAGGQIHQALIGRTFLRHCTLTYEGKTGNVVISND